jgi:septum formation topological specificity factor MinE
MEGETKDVIVNNNRYQLRRMNAAVGSWLLFKLIDSLRKIMAQNSLEDSTPEPQTEQDRTQKEQAAQALIQGMLMTLDRNLFEQVQQEALRVVGQYTAVGEEEVVLSVLMANGTFAIPELKTDISTVVVLTSHSLFFNLSPFFLTGGLNNILTAQASS